GGGGQDHARDGSGGLPEPEDDRVSPAGRLPQARHPLARPAGARSRRRLVTKQAARVWTHTACNRRHPPSFASGTRCTALAAQSENQSASPAAATPVKFIVSAN